MNVKRARFPRGVLVDPTFIFVTIHVVYVVPCSASTPKPPPPVTIADRIACMRVNPMMQLPVSTNPTATRPVGVAQIAFSTWTHSGAVNWRVHPSTTSRFCSCRKGTRRFSNHRETLIVFVWGSVYEHFVLHLINFDIWGEKRYFGSLCIVFGA